MQGFARFGTDWFTVDRRVLIRVEVMMFVRLGRWVRALRGWQGLVDCFTGFGESSCLARLVFRFPTCRCSESHRSSCSAREQGDTPRLHSPLPVF
jgi:hypothetical protein